MGMFLSQYSMLNAIAYGERGQMKEETDKILEPYKLFVLVLHDPEKHTLFNQNFSRLFERLDYLTGPNLLFMGIAKPSYDWYLQNKNRDYFGIWEKDQLIKSFQEIKVTEGSITCYSLANALRIDYDDLPSIIISPNLKSERFVVLKTGEQRIENQLMELGYFASSVTDQNADIYSEKFNLLLHRIDYYGQSEFMKHHEALGRSLADLFSFSVPENNLFGKDAKLHSNIVLDKLENIIIKAKNVHEIENAKMNLLTSLANKFNNLYKPFDDLSNACLMSEPGNSGVDIIIYNKDFLPIPAPVLQPTKNYFGGTLAYLKKNIDLLEQETKIIVSTTEAVYQMFRKMPEQKTLDFSPLVLGISKIFEIETNLSIVHWVRKHLNIEMPDYYKKFKPNCHSSFIIPDKTIVPNPKPIDSNMHKGTKWLAPGLGQSELIVRSLLKNNLLIESFTNAEELSLIKAWSPIRESRNRAAHSDIMDKRDLQNIALNMNVLIESNNLKKILQLKQQYNGNAKDTQLI